MANKTNIIAGLFKCFAYESITISNTVKQLTLATITDTDGSFAKRAIITVEDAQIRYRYDGTDPESSEGHLLNPMDTLVMLGTDNLKSLRFIRKGSTDGTIKVSYEI